MVTPISTVLRAATGNCDPVYSGCRCGLPYYSVYYKSHAVTVDLRRSQGHRQFSSAVTRSQAVFGWSQTVTLVAALSTAHIGVTTPCGGVHRTHPARKVSAQLPSPRRLFLFSFCEHLLSRILVFVYARIQGVGGTNCRHAVYNDFAREEVGPNFTEKS